MLAWRVPLARALLHTCSQLAALRIGFALCPRGGGWRAAERASGPEAAQRLAAVPLHGRVHRVLRERR
eukprot:7005449-Prymnesium_polylepis.1